MKNDQAELLARKMSHYLELFDEELQYLEVDLPDRPLRALIKLLLSGGIALRFGDERVDLSNPSDHAEEQWFKALYAALDYWYAHRYGAERVSPHNRKSELHGAVSIRGEVYSLLLPANRGKVEVEGELAWMYFEDGLGEGEDPVRWIIDAPKPDSLQEAEKERLRKEAGVVASTLRYIEFRRVAADRTRDPEAQKLVQATLMYLQHAAKRMVEGGGGAERGPAWFDLQMANESALKAAIRQATGVHPHTHSLVGLLNKSETLVLQQLTKMHDLRPNIVTMAMSLRPDGADIAACESDFILLAPNERGGRIQVLIGECKTRQPISEQDVANLRRVADAFPKDSFDVYIVFAKLADFSAEEIQRISSLNDEFRRRAIMLTARELEPWFIYERAEKIFDIIKHAVTFREMADNTHDIFIEPRLLELDPD